MTMPHTDDISRVTEIAGAASDLKVEAIRPGSPAARLLFDTLLVWLKAANLPTDDLADEQPRYFVLRSDTGVPLAFGGLSGTAPDFLLRSVVVDPAQRERGLGTRLLAALETIGRASGAERLWLLTTEAAGWFEKAGWRRMGRAEAPETIRCNGQFAHVCPATATLMVRDLRA